MPMLNTARFFRVLDHVEYPSAERRETHPPVQRYDAFTWSQDLDWIEVELLQLGDTLHQGRDTQQQRYERLTIARRSPTIAVEEDVGAQLRQHLSGITVAHGRQTECDVVQHLDQRATESTHKQR